MVNHSKFFQNQGKFWKYSCCWLGGTLASFTMFLINWLDSRQEVSPASRCFMEVFFVGKRRMFGFTGHRLEFHVVSQVASFGSLFVAPPVGLALGATSAAAGVSSTTGDVVGDAEPRWVDGHLDITMLLCWTKFKNRHDPLPYVA